MRGFGRRDRNEVERRLREGRAAAPPSLVDRIVSDVSGAGSPARRPTLRARMGVAVALTLGLLVVLASFGGFSYAQVAVNSTVGSAARTVKQVVKKPSKKKLAAKKKKAKKSSKLSSRYLAAFTTYYPGGTICHWNQPDPSYNNSTYDKTKNWDPYPGTASNAAVHGGHLHDFASPLVLNAAGCAGAATAP